MIEEQLKERPLPYALVTLEAADGRQSTREAALLYDTADGFAWIEPSYLDPWGTPSPALHFVEAKLEQTPDGFTFAGERWKGRVTFLEDLKDPRAAGLAWYAAELERTGKRWGDEREQLRRQVEADD